MRLQLLLGVALVVLTSFLVGCGGVANCPTCGTLQGDGYGVIATILVPEHNPTGEPGGPFNSFDISVDDPVHHRFYVSDRIGLAVVQVDTINNVALQCIEGPNGVCAAGNGASNCDPSIPPTISSLGNFTRYGCRNPPFNIPGFGANGHFGGFPGAQCCASRGNGLNPLSGPDGEAITADGNFLFIGNGSSAVVVFDLRQTPPTVVANIPTGQSPDYDGCVPSTFGGPCNTPGGFGPTPFINPNGIGPCGASANGRAFSDPTCGDLRADEMSWDETDKILLVANGDPGLPFITLIDMSGVITGALSGTGTPQAQHCLPVNNANPYSPTNFPTCILGQIYWDGAGGNNIGVTVDSAPAPCPDPSLAFSDGTPVPSGVSGTGVGAAGANVPCHHGPILANNTGQYCPDQTGAANPAALACAGAISPAGIGGSTFIPATKKFLVTNANSTGNLTVGSLDVVDPFNPGGPAVVNSFPVFNCMPSGVVNGPGNEVLVTCADHDGETFPPNEYIIDGTNGNILATIDTVGGVDEAWYNGPPGDNRYYLAARDMPNGPVMGVIDAKSHLWLQNVTTGSNSHSIAVEPSNNHAFVPTQSGAICGTISGQGCINVYAQQ